MSLMTIGCPPTILTPPSLCSTVTDTRSPDQPD